MYVQGKCYKCGGFLAVDESQDASVCPFCNKPFIVQKAIISYKETALPAEEIKMPSYGCDGDFVIERSMLVRYNGYTNKDIRIPDGITAIGENAFQGMSNIESVYIPEGVERIGAGAFSGCKNITYVHIPDGVETIDRDCFNGCVRLKTIEFPDSVKNIEAGALAGCISLEAVNIPPMTELLPWRIFEGCTSLKTLTIPENVKTIEDYACADCTALENVVFECLHSETGNSGGIIRIGMNAFRNCLSLRTLTIPETVKFIGNQAFRGCSSIEEITIPKSVKAIYPLAFADCSGLKNVTFAGDTELYHGSNPYNYEQNAATFLECPDLMVISYSKLQKNYWAFPAYFNAQESDNIENGRCRHCGGEFKGLFEKVCSVCKMPKDY